MLELLRQFFYKLPFYVRSLGPENKKCKEINLVEALVSGIVFQLRD